jgi:hypothetical protein
LDAIGGYIDGVNGRAESNMPATTPPCPNRLLRRQEIERQIEQSLLAPKLEDLYQFIPRSYMGPEFIRQLLEGKTRKEVQREIQLNQQFMDVDQHELVNLIVNRKSDKAPQRVSSKLV